MKCYQSESIKPKSTEEEAHASQSTHILAGIVSILLIGFNKSVIYDQHSSDSSTIWTGLSH